VKPQSVKIFMVIGKFGNGFFSGFNG